MPNSKLLAVAGQPILHSLSPALFNWLFREMGMGDTYIRLSASSAREATDTAASIGIRGLNVTSPLKEAIFSSIDEPDSHSREIQAVNCLGLARQPYRGYNTDFIGAVHALKKNGVDPRNKRIAVLGAGGAARAAAYGLLRAKAKKVTLINRTRERAEQASARLGCDYARIEHTGDVLNECDVLVSCIPSPERIIDPVHIHKKLLILDASYKRSRLLADAESKGCRIINGLDWLVHQAIPAFKLFTKRGIPKGLRQIIREGGWQEKENKKSNIALVGFMGAGKTEVGKLLAEKLSYRFVDTDDLIEKIAGMTVSEIFQNWGEASFRGLEKAVIRKIVPDTQKYLFSLGGGALLNSENVRIVKERCHTVWLWASAATIRRRVPPFSRPLLPFEKSPGQTVRLLEERIPCYAGGSDLVINNENCDAAKTAERIKNEMDQAFEN